MSAAGRSTAVRSLIHTAGSCSAPFLAPQSAHSITLPVWGPHRTHTSSCRPTAITRGAMSSDKSIGTVEKVEAPPPPPAFPKGYVPPTVWTFTPQEGKMGGMNRPTAGARSEKELPIGEHPLQLYSLGTPNGQKVTILLEELFDLKGVEYDAWMVKIFDLEQFTSGFVAVNPNSKIPALLDHEFTPPLRVFESCSILKYLAEKYGAFIPEEPHARAECFNWLFWQHGGAPFMGGGFGHFYNYAPIKIEYAIDRYSMETKRQLDVLDRHLQGKDYMCGCEYSIADIAIYPWIVCLDKGYNAAEFLQLKSYSNVQRWLASIAARPAVQRGMRLNRNFGEDPVEERHSPADFDKKPSS